MLFRLANNWLKTGFSAAAVCALFVSSTAWGTLSVRSMNKGTTTTINNKVTAFYYAYTDVIAQDIPATAFFDAYDPDGYSSLGPVKVDVASTVARGAVAVDNRSNILTFQISSTSTFSDVADAMYAAVKIGNIYVPIIQVNGLDCTSTTCADQFGGYYYAAKFTKGQAITVGIYPKEVCEENVEKSGPAVSACTAGRDISNFSSTVVLKMGLTFQLYSTSATLLPDVGGGSVREGSASPAATSRETLDVDLSFQNGNAATPLPSAACTKASLYYPGDGEITVQTGSVAFTHTSTAAPASKLIGVAQLAGSPTINSSYGSANTLYTHLNFGSDQAWAGFENSTDNSPKNYGVEFLVRDAGGLIVRGSNCDLSNLQTAAIFGFLKKSNCFIATAAYGSLDAAPVAMLRKFRDQVLLKHPAGRSFVNWYYSWSPAAAKVVIENPILKYPVLAALIPFEIMAWIILHPGWMEFLAGVAGILLFGTLFLALRSRTKGEVQ